MPGLIRKILVFAATDGLILQPLNQRERITEAKPLRIAYGTGNSISETQPSDQVHDGRTIEAFGVVGLLNLVKTSYVVFITRREQVATIRKCPIYTIKDVTLIPIASQSDAEKAIQRAKVDAQSALDGDGYESGEIDEGADTRSLGDETESLPETEPAATPESGVVNTGISIAKDVIQDKGRYGLFAQRWFSKGSGKQEVKRDEQLASKDGAQVESAAKTLPEVRPSESVLDGTIETPPTESLAVRNQPAIETLGPRIVHHTKLYFSSSSFFFSYDYDLSASLTKQQPPGSTTPLWKRFNEVFFWNSHLVAPFTQVGVGEYALPLLQGFVGQRKFSIEENAADGKDAVGKATQNSTSPVQQQSDSNDQPASHEFLLTLISRRSNRRAGLRYLRRGIDDEGHAANFVETEQLLATNTTDPSHKAFSLVQIRGSIPLFFSQSPYSFKPLPEMHGSEAMNQKAFAKHFGKLFPYYGNIQCASLVDKHGTEKQIGEAYERHAGLLNENGGIGGKRLSFEWFDFHSACKGMKFENVSILMETLQESLSAFGWTEKQQGKTLRHQTGVLRTNCMDCLDRTNVVQSAVAGQALQQQLAQLDLNIDLQTDPKTQWFNTLWADNGDAISKQYAGTAALKGDFTRTRKRNWTGALSDFSLTLNRYWNNIFSDYFMQTVIDFELGNASTRVFDDFETNMMSQDYAIDMQRVRQNAIDTCVKMVLEDPQEDLTAGWTLSCPQKSNTLRSLPFEECVLLLTECAMYFCRFDWDTEKVGSFERVALTEIKRIWRGAYITSTLGDRNLDESTNVGFAVEYAVTSHALVRTNTRSLQNEEPLETKEFDGRGKTDSARGETRMLGFKALPPKASVGKHGLNETPDMTELELVKHVCGRLQKSMEEAHRKSNGPDHLELEKVPGVEQRDVVSVADARKKTGYIESVGYSLKKLVWS